MNKLVVCVAVLAMLVAMTFATYTPDHNDWTFERFLSTYKPAYADAESNSFNVFDYEVRRQIFASNLATIKAHNKRYEAGLETWFMKPTQFADLTEAEFESKWLGYDKSSPASNHVRANRLQKLTSSADKIKDFQPIDWAAKGVVSIVNQGSCGSCWANAAATTLGALANIQYGEKASPSNYPSRQAFTSCVVNEHKCGGEGGCKGATSQLAYSYMKDKGGVALEADYPYTSGSGSDGVCKDNQFKAKLSITGHQDIIPNNRTALYEQLKLGPVSVSAYASGWSFYGGGVFTKCSQYNINHAITLVASGFDAASNQYFWTIANSWGSGWGEQGYMRLLMANPDQAEQCGTDTAPYDGSACADDPSPRTLACGCNGILYDSTVPVGIQKL